jgi:hypothetical protein
MLFARILQKSSHRLSLKRFGPKLKRGAQARGPDQMSARLEAASATLVATNAPREPDMPDVRNGVLFKVFECPASDEPTIDPNDLSQADAMAERGREFYKLRSDLFPPDDIFYEEVEASFIDRVTRIDNAGGKDQFVSTLDWARRLSNDNTRKLLCQVTPAVLGAMLVIYAGFLLFVAYSGRATIGQVLSAEAARLVVGGALLGLGVAAIVFTYRFSYTHIQRANALSLNAFIATEFSHLNNAFRVAQREALQAETQLPDTQRDQIKHLASSWTLAYHWISVRQFFEEAFVRNTMFQIRRNTTLYKVLGVAVSIGVFLTVTAFITLVSSLFATQTLALVVHLAVVAGVFMLVAYRLIMRQPFSILASALLKDEWYRHDTLAIGDAIAEQVTRDKVQIVLNRDRARAAGV